MGLSMHPSMQNSELWPRLICIFLPQIVHGQGFDKDVIVHMQLLVPSWEIHIVRSTSLANTIDTE